jgi:hypothetical protein
MEQNVTLIKKFYELFRNGDKKYLQMCDENIEWVTMAGMPSGGRYVGKSQIFDVYFPNMFANFTEFHAVTEQFFSSGETVIVTGRYQGVAKTDKRFDVPFAHFYSIQNNKIAKFRQYTDTQQIRLAMGL